MRFLIESAFVFVVGLVLFVLSDQMDPEHPARFLVVVLILMHMYDRFSRIHKEQDR